MGANYSIDHKHSLLDARSLNLYYLLPTSGLIWLGEFKRRLSRQEVIFAPYGPPFGLCFSGASLYVSILSGYSGL